MAFSVGSNLVIDSNRNFIVGSGTVRPSAPETGRMWFNTVTGVLEGWDGSSWVPLVTNNNVAMTWGANAWGALGNGSSGPDSKTSSPTTVVGGFTDWIQISASDLFNGFGSSTVAIRANGTAWAWGINGGRLGDNTTSSRSSPVSVVGGFTDWVQISVGGSHTVAIRANGTAWGWGRNTKPYGYSSIPVGQLGDNTTSSRLSPVSVVGGFTDWVQIDAGWWHTAAIRANGTAWCWGDNVGGKLGDNTTSSRSSPVSVVGGFTDWVQISAGQNHTAAIRANGTAWAWGVNAGRLGDGTGVDRSSPVSVVGGFTDWVQISAGPDNTVAIRANGTAWAWGWNNWGKLGDNTTSSRLSPVSVVGGFTDWVQVSAGTYHTAAIRANGTAWTWGANGAYFYGFYFFGSLGTGNQSSSSLSPVSVVGGINDWVQISAGAGHTAAIR